MENIETYRALLRINKHALDEALEVQPDVMERISREMSRLERRAAELRDERKAAEAQAVKDARTAGGSVADAEASMRADPFRRKAVALEMRADEELSEWKGLYEAWKARGYSIKDLVGLYAAQYFTANPGTNFSRREQPARRDYTETRGDPAPRTRTRVG